MKKAKDIFIILLIGLSINKFSYSQDLKAGQIFVWGISDMTYVSRLSFYYDSTLFTPRPFVLLDWGDGSIDSLFYMGIGGATGNTILVNYQGIHTYSSQGSYVISCTDSFRIANIQNISNSVNEKMYLEYQLTVSSFWGSNSAPCENVLVDQCWNCGTIGFSLSCSDADGDSLSFSLIPPFTSNYTFPPSAFINSATGYMTFNPIAIGSYSFCIRIDEWRGIGTNLYLIGSSFLDILVEVNSLASLNEINFQSQIAIYPNPSSNWTSIKLADEFLQNENIIISIIDIYGREVFTDSFQPISNAPILLNLASLANGVYILKVNANSLNGNKTLIISH